MEVAAHALVLEPNAAVDVYREAVALVVPKAGDASGKGAVALGDALRGVVAAAIAERDLPHGTGGALAGPQPSGWVGGGEGGGDPPSHRASRGAMLAALFHFRRFRSLEG